MTTPSLPTYIEITTALKKIPSDFSAAQIHGYFCGLICLYNGKNSTAWKKRILGSKKNKEAQETLQDLYETSYHQISEFSFEFDLLLPDDEGDINTRTEALGLWCQGFITGLAQENTRQQNTSAEASETLNDIIEISQVSYGDIADTDEDESAYFELVEYVRLGVLMIYTELQSEISKEEQYDKND